MADPRICEGLVRGRIRMADERGSSLVTLTFREALARASVDDLQYVMDLFVRNPQVHRTWRKKRMRAMAQRMRELLAKSQEAQDE